MKGTLNEVNKKIFKIERIKTDGNSIYQKGGVSFFIYTFVVAESSVLRMKFSGKYPALQVAAKRYG